MCGLNKPAVHFREHYQARRGTMDILQPNKTFQLSSKTVFSPRVHVLNGRWIFIYLFLCFWLNPDIMNIKLRDWWAVFTVSIFSLFHRFNWITTRCARKTTTRLRVRKKKWNTWKLLSIFGRPQAQPYDVTVQMWWSCRIGPAECWRFSNWLMSVTSWGWECLHQTAVSYSVYL